SVRGPLAIGGDVVKGGRSVREIAVDRFTGVPPGNPPANHGRLADAGGAREQRNGTERDNARDWVVKRLTARLRQKPRPFGSTVLRGKESGAAVLWQTRNRPHAKVTRGRTESIRIRRAVVNSSTMPRRVDCK